MIRSLSFAVLIVSASLLEASPRNRRDEKVQKYCLKHEDHYNKYCRDQSRMDGALHAKLAKFCPAYEKHCTVNKGTFVDNDEDESLVVPPPLPRGGDFAALDLPIGRETGSSSSSSSSSSKGSSSSNQRLTAAIIASCTPECTAPQCTDECKCAHTHPKVHAMCNPPATAALADTCQKWYSKCPMFQPVAYY